MLSVLLLSACADKDNLPPPHALVNFKPTLQTTKLWTVQPDKWATGKEQGVGEQYLFLRPVVMRGVVYSIDYRGYLTATRARDGHRLWQKQLGVKVSSGLTKGANQLLLATTSGDIMAVDLQGRVRWQASVDNSVIAPLNAGRGLVLANTIDGKVFALNSQTGQREWSYNNASPLLVLRGGSQPQIAGNRVIVGFADGSLLALSLTQGKRLWQTTVATPAGATPLQQMVDITMAPIVSGKRVYVASYQGQIVALDVARGRVLWHRDMSAYTGMALGTHDLFVSDAESNLWALNPRNGAVDWKQRNLSWRFITAPVIMGNYLVVADAEGYIHWMRQENGEFAARQTLSDDFGKPSGIYAAPVVENKVLYAWSHKGWLGAYAVANGGKN